jgi:hypothetical protein
VTAFVKEKEQLAGLELASKSVPTSQSDSRLPAAVLKRLVTLNGANYLGIACLFSTPLGLGKKKKYDFIGGEGS